MSYPKDVRSAGRLEPSDVETSMLYGRKPGEAAVAGPGAHTAADADYWHNFAKFRRTDDMAAEPTRSKANESSMKP